MSLQSKGIGLAKKAKSILKNQIKEHTAVYISPVRRINGVKLNERVCAMTFDDGPCSYPANPAKEDGLTLSLLKTLEKHGAKGTFDCIGDTSSNYPDVCGELGTAMWGGKAFDHYPDFGQDEYAGIANCSELVDRILSYGHEVTNHSFIHRIWGKKPFVYQDRIFIGDISEVIADLQKFDDIMREEHGFCVALGRPPHYVDKIDGKFTSYDAYAVLGYQYLGAGPDGGGWLPGASYEDEVEAMRSAIADPLAADPDCFCGQIIFQKDGCNMMKRTPVADGLDLQLCELDKYGYKVVTVSELLRLSQFEDIGPGDEGFELCRKMLEKGLCPAFSDNCIHPERKLSSSEAAMVLYGWQAACERVKDGAKGGSAYKYALEIAAREGMLSRLESVVCTTKTRLEAYEEILNLC